MNTRVIFLLSVSLMCAPHIAVAQSGSGSDDIRTMALGFVMRAVNAALNMVAPPAHQDEINFDQQSNAGEVVAVRQALLDIARDDPEYFEPGYLAYLRAPNSQIDYLTEGGEVEFQLRILPPDNGTMVDLYEPDDLGGVEGETLAALQGFEYVANHPQLMAEEQASDVNQQVLYNFVLDFLEFHNLTLQRNPGAMDEDLSGYNIGGVDGNRVRFLPIENPNLLEIITGIVEENERLERDRLAKERAARTLEVIDQGYQLFAQHYQQVTGRDAPPVGELGRYVNPFTGGFELNRGLTAIGWLFATPRVNESDFDQILQDILEAEGLEVDREGDDYVITGGGFPRGLIFRQDLRKNQRLNASLMTILAQKKKAGQHRQRDSAMSSGSRSSFGATASNLSGCSVSDAVSDVGSSQTDQAEDIYNEGMAIYTRAVEARGLEPEFDLDDRYRPVESPMSHRGLVAIWYLLSDPNFHRAGESSDDFDAIFDAILHDSLLEKSWFVHDGKIVGYGLLPLPVLLLDSTLRSHPHLLNCFTRIEREQMVPGSPDSRVSTTSNTSSSSSAVITPSSVREEDEQANEEPDEGFEIFAHAYEEVVGSPPPSHDLTQQAFPFLGARETHVGVTAVRHLLAARPREDHFLTILSEILERTRMQIGHDRNATVVRNYFLTCTVEGRSFKLYFAPTYPYSLDSLKSMVRPRQGRQNHRHNRSMESFTSQVSTPSIAQTTPSKSSLASILRTETPTPPTTRPTLSNRELTERLSRLGADRVEVKKPLAEYQPQRLSAAYKWLAATIVPVVVVIWYFGLLG